MRNSFMRHWWAVEVRTNFLPFLKSGDQPTMLGFPSGHSDVSTVIVYTIAFVQTFCFGSYSYVVVGAVVVGGSWYLARLARGPHSKPKLRSNSPNFSVWFHAVIWTKSNPTPWNDVKQDENVKMMAVNQKFEKRSVRGSSSLA